MFDMETWMIMLWQGHGKSHEKRGPSITRVKLSLTVEGTLSKISDYKILDIWISDIKFWTKNQYFGQFRTNISHKKIPKFPFFFLYFWQFCLN